MLFLNGTVGLFLKPESFNENFVKWNEGYGAFGYIVSERFYDILIDKIEKVDEPIDNIYSMFMQFFKVYKLKVPLIFHKSGVSDIMGIVPKNYKHLER